jgi:DNA-binding MarR family transcriptional regulator
MGDDFPTDVKEFIRQHIHSLAQLEVLLTLRNDPARLWSVDEITNLLFLRRPMVHDLLTDLVRRGFVIQDGESFRYQPTNDAVRQLIDRLAEIYHERRVAVTTEIFSKPIDFVKAFANAFRLREEK